MRHLLFVFAVLGLLAAGLASALPAEAAPWDPAGLSYRCGGGRASPCGPIGPRCSSWNRYARGRSYACRSSYRGYGYGRGWTTLRRYSSRIRISNRHIHSRFYWFNRWSCRLGDARSQGLWGGHRCIGDDYPHNECVISKAALGLDDAPEIDFAALGHEARLERGMERFFRGAYAKAKEDFREVLVTRPRDARARYGVLMCALMSKDRDAASDELTRLYEQGQVSGSDRLVLDSCFVDGERFKTVRDGLASYARYNFQNTDALTVAAWTSAVTGEVAAAKRQAKAALRFAPKNKVARHLLATLDDDPTPTIEPKPVPVTHEDIEGEDGPLARAN